MLILHLHVLVQLLTRAAVVDGVGEDVAQNDGMLLVEHCQTHRRLGREGESGPTPG